MPKADILTVIMGASSFLGFLGLVAFLYFTLQLRHAEQSVRKLLEGETIFNAEQVLNIIAQFKDDRLRLDALIALTRYDRSKAADLLNKVKDNIDVTRFSETAAKRYRRLAFATAAFFSILTALAFVYSRAPDLSPKETSAPAASSVTGTSVEDFVGRLRSDDKKTRYGARDELTHRGATAFELINQLLDYQDYRVQLGSVYAFANMPDDQRKQAPPDLLTKVQALQHSTDSTLQERAVQALKGIQK